MGDGGYGGAFQAETLSIDLLGGYYTRGGVGCQDKSVGDTDCCGRRSPPGRGIDQVGQNFIVGLLGNMAR